MKLTMNSRIAHLEINSNKGSKDVLCIHMQFFAKYVVNQIFYCFYKSQPGSQKGSGKSSADKTRQQNELPKAEPMNTKENYEIAKKDLQIQELQNR